MAVASAAITQGTAGIKEMDGEPIEGSALAGSAEVKLKQYQLQLVILSGGCALTTLRGVRRSTSIAEI